ncbi:MAG: carboxypeptidase-like regulatory domain-containing protein [Terracidiphilus sp.]|jgi:hypothetical protein
MNLLNRKQVLYTAAMTMLLATSLAQVSRAQQTPYVVGSTVTGHVYCADSNAPARFAKVLLKSTAGGNSGDDFLKKLQENMAKMADKSGAAAEPAKPMTADKKSALAAASKGMTQALDMMNASTVGLDGEFKFAGVKPGTYYVHAIYAGYIDPFDQLTDEDFASTDPAVRARIAQIPTVTVTGSDAAHAELRLERGGAISGTILFDDGSPASGWIVSVIKPGTAESGADATAATMSQALAMSGAVQLAKSDDLGRFRITGLSAGDYALRASLNAMPIGVTGNNIGDGGSGISLVVYSGSTFNRGDAKVVSVGAGDESTGVDMTVNAHGLHNITGHVVAKADAHTVNVGSVALTSKSNPALHMSAAIRDDGSFHFEYLPKGVTYTLTVADAADGKNAPAGGTGFMGLHLPDPEILRKYGSDTTDVLLGDSDVDSVQLTVAQTDWKPTPKKPGASNANLGDLLNGIVGAASSDKQ